LVVILIMLQSLVNLVVVEKRLQTCQPGSVPAPSLPELFLRDENGVTYHVPSQPEGFARLINMDCTVPNTVAGEWLAAEGLGPLRQLAAEQTVGNSRFDFTAVAADGTQMAIEVKGCTLEQNGLAQFPDAPTLRGVKHLQGLTELVGRGWSCCVCMVVQMEGIHTFRPNWQTHRQFGVVLQQAVQAGVQLKVLGCKVTPDSLQIIQEIPADLTES